MTLELWTKSSLDDLIFNFMTVHLNLSFRSVSPIILEIEDCFWLTVTMKRVVETEDAFYNFLFIPIPHSEKFHYKLLSGPCQSLASAPSNSKQRHLDLSLEHRDILVTILTVVL